MRTITYDEVMEQVKSLRNSRRVNPIIGNWEDEFTCIYSNRSGNRHCLAATIVDNLGAPVPSFEDEKANQETFAKLVNQGWWDERGFQFDPDAKALLDSLQWSADANRTPWCVAIALALKDS